MIVKHPPVAVLATLTLLIVTGCQHPSPVSTPRPGPKPGTRAAIQQEGEVWLTGLALRGTDLPLKEQFIDFRRIVPDGIAVPPNLVLLSNHDQKVHLRYQDGSTEREFDGLIGANEDALIGHARIHSSILALTVVGGWVVLTGDAPQAETEWGSGSSPSTQWAIQIIPGDGPERDTHRFYNLEPEDPNMSPEEVALHTVTVTGPWADGEKPVPPGQYVDLVKDQKTPPVCRNIEEDDQFLRFVRPRCDAARMPLRTTPSDQQTQD